MKKINFLWVALFAAILTASMTLTSCGDDEDDDVPTPTGIEGTYWKAKSLSANDEFAAVANVLDVYLYFQNGNMYSFVGFKGSNKAFNIAEAYGEDMGMKYTISGNKLITDDGTGDKEEVTFSISGSNLSMTDSDGTQELEAANPKIIKMGDLSESELAQLMQIMTMLDDDED